MALGPQNSQPPVSSNLPTLEALFSGPEERQGQGTGPHLRSLLPAVGMLWFPAVTLRIAFSTVEKQGGSAPCTQEVKLSPLGQNNHSHWAIPLINNRD